jgi:AcrR family transcriptional regulator
LAPSPQRTALSTTALRILEAARHVVDVEGTDRLTLRAVAKRADVPISLVIYHFSSMSHLEALLLDSLWRENVTDHLRDLESPPSDAGARVELLIRFHQRIADNLDGYLTYFGLATHAIRNEETRRDVARLYDWYRQALNYPLVTSGPYPEPEAQALAALTLAVAEGLPFTCLIGGSRPEMDAGFELMTNLLKERCGASPAWSEQRDCTAPSDGSTRQVACERPRWPEMARRLLAGGKTILNQRGLRELTLGNIAEAAQASPGLIGYHFRNKQGFLDSLVKSTFEEWAQTLSRVAKGSTGVWPDELRGQVFGPRSPLAAALILVPAVSQKPARVECANHYYSLAVDELATFFAGKHQAERGYSPRVAAFVFLSALHGLVLQSLYDPEGFDPMPAVIALQRILPI